MRKAALAVGALLALAPCACRDKGAPMSAGFKQALQSVASTAPCDTAIPQEWFQSLPVPTGQAGGQEFKVLFYPRGAPDTPDFVSAPLGEAVFRSDGAVASCRRLPGATKGLSSRRWPKATDSLSAAQLEAALDRLYAATEQAAALYAAQAPADGPAKRVLEDYSRQFQALAEPALLPFYYQANPDFWQWLEKSGAPAFAKP